MSKLFHPLFLLLARSTHDELVRQIQYLKVESQILRSKLPKRVTLTPGARFLAVNGHNLQRMALGKLTWARSRNSRQLIPSLVPRIS